MCQEESLKSVPMGACCDVLLFKLLLHSGASVDSVGSGGVLFWGMVSSPQKSTRCFPPPPCHAFICVCTPPLPVPNREYYLRATIAGSTRNTGISMVADGLWHYLCVSWQPAKHLLTVAVDADQACAKDTSLNVYATDDDDVPATSAETANDRVCRSSSSIT